jgi:hypothetical protein
MVKRDFQKLPLTTDRNGSMSYPSRLPTGFGGEWLVSGA